MNLLDFIKRHWLVLVLAVLVSLIYGSHHFLMPSFLGPDSSYYPVTLVSNFDEASYYSLRANAAYLGQLSVGDISLIEYIEGPTFLPMLNPLIMGWVGKIAGSIHSAFIISDFLFPLLIFLVLYFLALELIRSQILALLFSIIFIFVPKIFLYLPPVSSLNLRELFYSIFPILNASDWLYFSRFEYPKITFVFYVLAFYLLLLALKNDKKIYLYLSGLSFGILFYTYLYDWAYFLIGLIIVGLFFAMGKDYAQVKKLFYIIGIGFLVSIFYWINFWQLSHLPQYNDIVYRIGVEIGDSFRWATAWKSYLRIGVLLAFLWWLCKENKKILFYLSGFLLSYFVVMNAQIILGFNIHPDHWYRSQFLVIALSFLVLSYFFYQKYLKPYLKPKYIICCGLIFIILFLAQEVYIQYSFSKTASNRYSMPISVTESYGWLNENTPKYSVVATLSGGTNREIMLHTHNKIFLPSGLNSLAPNDEIWQRLMIMGKAFGINLENFVGLAKDNNLYLFQDFYRSRDFNSHFDSSAKREIPDLVLKEKQKEYQLLNPDFKSLLYQLDYFYFGPREKLISPGLLEINNLEKVYDKDNILIYKLTR